MGRADGGAVKLDQPRYEICPEHFYTVYDAQDAQDIAMFRLRADAEWYVKMREVKK